MNVDGCAKKILETIKWQLDSALKIKYRFKIFCFLKTNSFFQWVAVIL